MKSESEEAARRAPSHRRVSLVLRATNYDGAEREDWSLAPPSGRFSPSRKAPPTLQRARGAPRANDRTGSKRCRPAVGSTGQSQPVDALRALAFAPLEPLSEPALVARPGRRASASNIPVSCASTTAGRGAGTPYELPRKLPLSDPQPAGHAEPGRRALGSSLSTRPTVRGGRVQLTRPLALSPRRRRPGVRRAR